MPKTSNAPADDRLTAFPPVPGRARDDGWTPDKQRRFIDLLADSGSVTRAAALVGMSKESAYRLRRRAGAAAFAEAWDLAVTLAARVLADACLTRAVEGQQVPVFYKGEQVGTRIVHSDRLAMFMLRALDPIGYGDIPRHAVRTIEPADVPALAARRLADGWDRAKGHETP